MFPPQFSLLEAIEQASRERHQHLGNKCFTLVVTNHSFLYRQLASPGTGAYPQSVENIHTENILIVWKADGVRSKLESYLGSQGYHVSCSDSLSGAFDLLAGEKFDLVISGENLPDGAVDTLTRQDVPVVTLELKPGAAIKAREGFAMRLTAPIPENGLLDIIEEVLRNNTVD